jgi:pimeloyl-ACP methyl ester carboxylesterase
LNTIVLLPGMDGTGLLFDAFKASLGPDFEVVVVCYPTEKALGYADLERIALKALPTDRPFHLLGESFSGPIAISLAATNPPGLRGLMLCCSFVRNPRPLLGSLPLIRRLPLKVAPSWLSSRLLMGRHSTPALRAAFDRAIAMVSPSALQARMRSVIGVDVSEKLKRLKMPILYFRGTEDRVVPHTAGKLVQQLAPHSNIVDLPAPHCLLQTMPDEAAAAVRAHLSVFDH